MCSVFHFLRKDVAGIDNPRDMGYENSSCVLSFAHTSLAKVEVFNSFSGNGCRPLDAGLVVVIDGSAVGGFRNSEVMRPVLDGFDFFDAFVRGGSARATRGVILVDGSP